MKHLFLPYELAVIAKEKEFNEPCNRSYDTYGNECNTLRYDKNSELIGYASSPLYQQIVDWFREKHNILIYWMPDKTNSKRLIFYPQNGTFEPVFDFYTGLNKAIEEAFKLI